MVFVFWLRHLNFNFGSFAVGHDGQTCIQISYRLLERLDRLVQRIERGLMESRLSGHLIIIGQVHSGCSPLTHPRAVLSDRNYKVQLPSRWACMVPPHECASRARARQAELYAESVLRKVSSVYYFFDWLVGSHSRSWSGRTNDPSGRGGDQWTKKRLTHYVCVCVWIVCLFSSHLTPSFFEACSYDDQRHYRWNFDRINQSEDACQ